MDLNIATFISLLVLGTGIFTLLMGAAVLNFGNNKTQGLVTLVIGVIVLGLWAVLNAGALDNAEVMGGTIGFFGAMVGAIAGFGMFIMAIMKS